MILFQHFLIWLSKGPLNSLINGESQSLGRQGKNKDLSSGTGARARALHRGTAFPGRGGWEGHSRGEGQTPRQTLGEGDSAGACPHDPTRSRACSRTARAEAGRPGEALVSTDGARGEDQPCGCWDAPASVSWQKWPSHHQAAERSRHGSTVVS